MMHFMPKCLKRLVEFCIRREASSSHPLPCVNMSIRRGNLVRRLCKTWLSKLALDISVDIEDASDNATFDSMRNSALNWIPSILAQRVIKILAEGVNMSRAGLNSG